MGEAGERPKRCAAFREGRAEQVFRALPKTSERSR
jgi:hypothetical protein